MTLTDTVAPTKRQGVFPGFHRKTDEEFDSSETTKNGVGAIGQNIKELAAHFSVLSNCKEIEDRRHALTRIQELATQTSTFAKKTNTATSDGLLGR